MSAASQGRAREHRVRDVLEAAGYPAIMRAAGSKGAADLLHGNEFVGAVLVQVGTKSKSLGPEARMRFLGAAQLCNALPILAQVIEQRGRRTEYLFWVVDSGPASGWDRWELS